MIFLTRMHLDKNGSAFVPKNDELVQVGSALEGSVENSQHGGTE